MNIFKRSRGCQISDNLDVKKILAEKAGISHDTYHKALKILNEGNAKTIADIESKEKSINSAYREIKKEEKKKEYLENLKKTQVESGILNCRRQCYL
jgi:peptidyl-tRNA hydrolase